MDERRLHRCTVPSTSDRRTSDEGQSDLGLTVLPDFPAHVASIRGFPDTERELKLRAGDCRKLLIRRRKKQQGNSREDLIVPHLRAQALDADGLCSNPATLTDQLYVLGLCFLAAQT